MYLLILTSFVLIIGVYVESSDMQSRGQRAFKNLNLKMRGGLLENSFEIWFEKLVPKIYSIIYNDVFAVGLNGGVYMDGRCVGRADKLGHWILNWQQLKKTQHYR